MQYAMQSIPNFLEVLFFFFPKIKNLHQRNKSIMCKQADLNSAEAIAQTRSNERLACLLWEAKLAAHSFKCSYVSI